MKRTMDPAFEYSKVGTPSFRFFLAKGGGSVARPEDRINSPFLIQQLEHFVFCYRLPCPILSVFFCGKGGIPCTNQVYTLLQTALIRVEASRPYARKKAQGWGTGLQCLLAGSTRRIVLALGVLASLPAFAFQSSHPATAPSGQISTVALDPHPTVALTFDDLPAAGNLPAGQNRTKIATALSAELKASHLEGTYGFVNAVKLENDPDAQQALHIWLDAGMNIGSHTWSHISLTDNSAEAYEKEIALNEPALAQYAQVRDWHWFRFPYLWEGDTLEKRHAVRSYLREHNYRTAQVTLDFEDYAWNDAYARCSVKPDAEAISWLKQSYLENAAEYIRLGREEERIAFGHEIPNVLLLHATAFTTLMLPDLVELLRKDGFRFAALAEVEQDPTYAQDPDTALKYGGTLPDQFMDAGKLPYPKFKEKPFDKLKSLCQ
jgi:peptidoglycan-N-acetylglucosamine deacetylase